MESLALSEVERVDDIFGYEKLVAAEKAILQKGINHRVGKITWCFLGTP